MDKPEKSVQDDAQIATIPNTLEQIPESDEEHLTYKDSTYEIVSKIAYLLGVPQRIFENEYEAPKLDLYEKLEQEKAARIVRHLCIVRTAIERNFKHINGKMMTEYRSVLTMPEYVPSESIEQLRLDGVSFFKNSSKKLYQHIIEVNRLISDRINNCKKFFPLWLNWQYVKDLFIMPNGLQECGTKAAASIYYQYKACYPYQVYMNWSPKDEGNVLYNDKKFVTLLYRWHNDYFTEYSKVSDAGSYIKGSIYEFIASSEKVVLVVDCENSDPYKLCATLKGLDYQHTQKIASVILFDDVHTASAWRILESFTKIPFEHILIERVKQNKSLVDIMLTARACQEHYKNNVDSFIIVSSDSDYWGLISSLSEARFLVMIERGHSSPDLRNALLNAGIFYCYIDDFYSGDSEDIKMSALYKEMYRYIDSTVRLNVNTMLEEALRATRIDMSNAEKKQFMAQHIRTMQMSIAQDGEVVLEFKNK